MAILFVVLTAGTIGHFLLGLDFIVALHQMVITVSTVGYGEIGNVDAVYKIFTIALVLSGALGLKPGGEQRCRHVTGLDRPGDP